MERYNVFQALSVAESLILKFVCVQHYAYGFASIKYALHVKHKTNFIIMNGNTLLIPFRSLLLFFNFVTEQAAYYQIICLLADYSYSPISTFLKYDMS